MKLGKLGEIVSAIFSKHTYTQPKQEYDYNSSPNREFDGRDSDEMHNIQAFRDILILRDEDAPGYGLRPVVAVNGCAMVPTDNGPKLFYNITVHTVGKTNVNNLSNSPLPLEISPGVKFDPKLQRVLKSDLENYYTKVGTARETIENGKVCATIHDAVSCEVFYAVIKYCL